MFGLGQKEESSASQETNDLMELATCVLYRLKPQIQSKLEKMNRS